MSIETFKIDEYSTQLWANDLRGNLTRWAAAVIYFYSNGNYVGSAYFARDGYTAPDAVYSGGKIYFPGLGMIAAEFNFEFIVVAPVIGIEHFNRDAVFIKRKTLHENTGCIFRQLQYFGDFGIQIDGTDGLLTPRQHNIEFLGDYFVHRSG